jgi:hypothetical protein
MSATDNLDPLENDDTAWGPPEKDAPSGKVWQCMACGKKASNKYSGGISYGWDVSCCVNAELVDADTA